MQIYEQLPLPQSYQNHKIAVQIMRSIQINITLLNISFLLQEITSLDIIHQSIFITITVILLLFSLKYERHVDTTRKKQFRKNVFALMSIAIGLLVTAKVPYYSLIFATITILFFLRMVSKEKIIKTSNFMWSKYDEIIFNSNLIYLSFVLLVQEKMINIDNRYALIPIWFYIFFMGCSMNAYFVFSFYSDRIFKRSVYFSNFKQKLGVVVINSHLFSFVTFLLHAYLDYSYVTPLQVISLIINLIQSFMLVCFFQEVILLGLAPKYTKEETIFRIQTRTYAEVYCDPKCLKDFAQNDNDCLICNEQAVLVNFPCGHLTICQKCQSWTSPKLYDYCIICRRRVAKKRFLSQQQRIRRGYRRKFFIQKKLLKNQYLCQS